jgi:hypothetical protein
VRIGPPLPSPPPPPVSAKAHSVCPSFPRLPLPAPQVLVNGLFSSDMHPGNHPSFTPACTFTPPPTGIQERSPRMSPRPLPLRYWWTAYFPRTCTWQPSVLHPSMHLHPPPTGIQERSPRMGFLSPPQVLVDGLFSSDMHPGNVMLLPDGRLGLIDFGQVCGAAKGWRGKEHRRGVGRGHVFAARAAHPRPAPRRHPHTPTPPFLPLAADTPPHTSSS